jgi:hypothetical protein
MLSFSTVTTLISLAPKNASRWKLNDDYYPPIVFMLCERAINANAMKDAIYFLTA